MKKTKLLTSLAAFVLVLGLGACNQPEEETTPDESESTTETTGTSESTPTTPTEGSAYAIVGDFDDTDGWDNAPTSDSKYYIPAGTTHYEVTVTIKDEPDYGVDENGDPNDPWAAGFRVVNYNTWDLAVGYDELAEGSEESLYGDYEKNIKVSWGETYDITITFGDTNSILVTVHEDGENEGETTPTLFGFDVDGVINYIDGGLIGNYSYEGSITTNIDEAIPVNCVEAEDGGYYLTFDKNETTYYICIIPVTSSSGTFTDLQYETTPTAIYYDDDLDGWVNDDGTYFLCYNASYKCLYASAIAEYGPSGSKGTSPIAHLYDYPTIEGIALSADSTQVAETQSLRIDVTYTPSTIGASNLEWESSDEDVATVEDGRVTGVAASETPVTIKATTKNGLTATIDITVTAYTVSEGLLCSYDFSLASNNTNSAMSAEQTLTLFNESFVAGESSTSIVTSIEGSPSRAYPTAGGGDTNTNLQLSNDCLKLGSSGNSGSVTLNLSQEVSKVVVKATCWASSGSNSASTLTINNVSISLSQAANEYATVADLNTDEFTFTSSTQLAISANNRLMIFTMELYNN